METVSFPLRIPARLIELAEFRGREEYVDKTTALKQLLYYGAEDYVLDLLSRGKISMGKAAELLEKTVFEIQQKALEKGIEIGATISQYETSKKHAGLLKKKD